MAGDLPLPSAARLSAEMAQQMANCVPEQYQQALGMQMANVMATDFLNRIADSLFTEDDLPYIRLRQSAHERARTLLHKHLSPQQNKEAAQYGCFGVTVKARRTLTRRARVHRFLINEQGWVEEHLPSGKVRRFCIVSRDTVPGPDTALAVLLMLRTDVRKFFATARDLGVSNR